MVRGFSFMNKKVFLVFSIFISLIFANSKVLASPAVETPSLQIEAKRLDEQAQVLSQYLASYDSPLQYHAQDFIDAANEYNLDWKLIPAIAGVESTFGRFIPGGYNAWGWGVYGNQAIYFKSWREGIFEVARGLRENYLDQGLMNPYQINRVYTQSPSWGRKVAYFIKDLDSFVKIAAVSGQPNLR